jgi:glycosyltransferase involved in cell wall biosynthesis
MRVLHVSKVGGIGGSERHLLDLLPALERRGAEVRMLVLRAPGAERFLEVLEDRRVSRVVVDAGRDANPFLMSAIGREMRRFRADVVHTHLVHGDVYGQAAARLSGVPALSSAHSVLPSFLREPTRSAERLALRSARRVIAISRFVASWLEANRLASAARIVVVPYGVDARAFEIDAARRADARARWGVGDQAFVVGMASRLVEGKGHEVAIDAVARASSLDDRIALVLAGTGPLAARFADRADASGGRIRTLGFVEDVPAFLAACDVVLVPTEPSLGEGFGLAALEGMAASRPVIVAAVASLPEVVGDAGVVVPPGDPEAISRALVALAADPVRTRALGEAGRSRAVERYGLDRMVTATTEVYDGILAR